MAARRSRSSCAELPHAELGADGEQLVDAVRARVPVADRLQSMCRELGRGGVVVQWQPQVLPERPGVARKQVVEPRLEQALDVRPRRADQLDAARERLEG